MDARGQRPKRSGAGQRPSKRWQAGPARRAGEQPASPARQWPRRVRRKRPKREDPGRGRDFTENPLSIFPIAKTYLHYSLLSQSYHNNPLYSFIFSNAGPRRTPEQSTSQGGRSGDGQPTGEGMVAPEGRPPEA